MIFWIAHQTTYSQAISIKFLVLISRAVNFFSIWNFRWPLCHEAQFEVCSIMRPWLLWSQSENNQTSCSKSLMSMLVLFSVAFPIFTRPRRRDYQSISTWMLVGGNCSFTHNPTDQLLISTTFGCWQSLPHLIYSWFQFFNSRILSIYFLVALIQTFSKFPATQWL